MKLVAPYPAVRIFNALLVAAAVLPMRATAATQDPVDQIDPGVAAEELGTVDRPADANGETSLPARAPDREAVVPSEPILAGAIRVEGATELAPSVFAPAIEPYLGRLLGPEELRALARDVAAAARASGFGLATAWVAPQNVTAGILRVTIDEGRIDTVEVQGEARDAVARRLEPLATGRALRTAELERRLLIAGDLAGVSLGRPRIVRREGRNVLVVRAESERVRGRATIDNSGTAAVGPVRARLNVDFTGLIATGDRLSIGGVVTPLQPREFQFVQAGYSMPVGRDGTEVAVRGNAGNSDAGAEFRDRGLQGSSIEAEISVSHPIVRTRAASLWGSATVTVRDSRLNRDGARVRDDRIVSATASLFGIGRIAGGRIRVRLSYVQGLDLLNMTQRGDPLASRPDAGGSFSSLGVWMQYERSLGDGFSVEFRGEGQFASRPLLASEEMGLGGRQFLRAWDYREMSGDSGAAGSLELRYDLTSGLPAPLRRLQFYAYADGGRVFNLAEGFGGGSLASAGGGVRAWFPGGFDAGIELGIPLTDGLFDPDPDPRISFNLGSRF
jgi:hemolysin activation/secretion protein